MSEWEVDSFAIETIGDMTSVGEGEPFAWIKASVGLRGGPNGSFFWFNIELPMAYRGDETIDAVRRRAHEEIIAALRVSASRLAERPPPPLGAKLGVSPDGAAG